MDRGGDVDAWPRGLRGFGRVPAPLGLVVHKVFFELFVFGVLGFWGYCLFIPKRLQTLGLCPRLPSGSELAKRVLF